MKPQTPYELKSHDFRVTIRSELNAAHTEAMLQKVLASGYAAAEQRVESHDDTGAEAILAADWSITPVLIGDTDLIPTTLRPTWTERDGVAARQEGWDIFYVDGSYHEIERLDDPEGRDDPVFKSDAEAIAHVVWHASAGSALHRKALAIMLHATNPSPAPTGPATRRY